MLEIGIHAFRFATVCTQSLLVAPRSESTLQTAIARAALYAESAAIHIRQGILTLHTKPERLALVALGFITVKAALASGFAPATRHGIRAFETLLT